MSMDERTLSRLATPFGLVGTLGAFASISGRTVPLMIAAVPARCKSQSTVVPTFPHIHAALTDEPRDLYVERDELARS